MWSALRFRSLSVSLSSSSSSSASYLQQRWKLGFTGCRNGFSSSNNNSLLDLQEVEKVLSDVKADDVKVIPVGKHCDWADYMVVATGRSTWHVKNIAQALIFKVKEKQRGAKRLSLPSVEGQEGGKWVVIDSGRIIVHALDEKARAYYDLENVWITEASQKESDQENDLGKALVKIRRKNNSKRPSQKIA